MRNKLEITKYDRFRNKTYRIVNLNINTNNLSEETINKLVEMWSTRIQPTEYLTYQEVVESAQQETGFSSFKDMYAVCVHLKSCRYTDIQILNYINTILNKLGEV